VTLLLAACASMREPPAPVGEEKQTVPAGVKPLTVEQEENSEE
jgi:hypothetical protein